MVDIADLKVHFQKEFDIRMYTIKKFQETFDEHEALRLRKMKEPDIK